MVRIKKVLIENFQSHENTVLELDDGLNVIIGPSDQGKSAIIRAVKWVLYNEPRGTEFIRHGATAARVTLEMDNGCSIIRERSKSKNRYSVINAEGSTASFEGFGNEVPEEVVKAHGIPKVMLDIDISSSLNISEQLEGPFMISESGAVRAKAIGRLTGIHIIDNAIRDCLVDLRRDNQTVDRIGKELEDINESLKQYDRLDEIEEKLKILEKDIEILNKSIKNKSRLDSLKKISDGIDSEASALSIIFEGLKNVKDCELLVKDTESALGRLNFAVRAMSSLEEVEKSIAQSEMVLTKTNNVRVCEDFIKDLKFKNESCLKLQTARRDIDRVSNESAKLEAMIKELKESDPVDSIVTEIVHKLERRGQLAALAGRMKNCLDEYKKVEKASKNLNSVPKCQEVFNEVVKKQDSLMKIHKLNEEYIKISSQINEGNNFMVRNVDDINKMLKDYKSELRRLGKCPLCESIIDEGRIDEILTHYEGVQQ